MKKSLPIFAFALLCCASVSAQETNRVSTFVRNMLWQYSKQMNVAATQMPADKYDFKAPPDDVTFGYLDLHTADGNYLYCSGISGVAAPELPQLSETDAKDILVQRMNASFDFCTKVLASLDDSGMKETLDFSG